MAGFSMLDDLLRSIPDPPAHAVVPHQAPALTTAITAAAATATATYRHAVHYRYDRAALRQTTKTGIIIAGAVHLPPSLVRKAHQPVLLLSLLMLLVMTIMIMLLLLLLMMVTVVAMMMMTMMMTIPLPSPSPLSLPLPDSPTRSLGLLGWPGRCGKRRTLRTYHLQQQQQQQQQR